MNIEKIYIRSLFAKFENRILDPDTLVFYRDKDAENVLQKNYKALEVYAIVEPQGDVYDALSEVGAGSESYGFLEPCTSEEADISLSAIRAEDSNAYRILREVYKRSWCNKLYIKASSDDLDGTYGGHYKIKEIDVEDKEFLDKDVPSRSTTSYFGTVTYTRKDYPLSFKIIDFLDSNEFSTIDCLARAFARKPSDMKIAGFDFDYNRNRGQITTEKINFDWVEENPEAALQKLYNRNRNEFSEKYKTYDEFLNAFNSKETDKLKRNKHRIFFVETRDSADTVRKAVNSLSSKYKFSVSSVGTGQVISRSSSSYYRHEIDLVFSAAKTKAALQSNIDKFVEELKELLPGSDVEDTGLASYYSH